MPNYVYIATSLDGFIADKDGGIDWLNEISAPEGDDLGFSKFLSKIDAIVMGRKTYETVLSFGQWPYTCPVFVLSNSLKQIDPTLDNKAFLIKGSPKEIVAFLKTKDFHQLYIDGGKTIQSFLEQDLIDEMIITVIPQVLGKGVPLFNESIQSKKYTATQTELLSIGAAKTHYKKII